MSYGRGIRRFGREVRRGVGVLFGGAFFAFEGFGFWGGRRRGGRRGRERWSRVGKEDSSGVWTDGGGIERGNLVLKIEWVERVIIVVIIVVVANLHQVVEKRRGDGGHLDGGSVLESANVFADLGEESIEVGAGVEILDFDAGVLEFEVGGEVSKVVVVGKVEGKVDVEENGSLVGPTATDVANGVSAAAENEGGEVVGGDEANAFGVAVQRQVEVANAIAA